MTYNHIAQDTIYFDDNYTDYQECINDLLLHPMVHEMKQFTHHKSTNCFYHSLNVSYTSYRICKTLGWDHRSAARGGMLHDLFLYDWRTDTERDGRHGFVHPKIALVNASNVAALSNLEKDIIIKHMFPLTWRPPSYKESLLVCLVDKYWAVKELFAYGKSYGRLAVKYLRSA
ncbi:MAG: HD family phosphohydrolase [Syntrophomonadaceae bacterium]|nr:HD family phosphohydrolase [Syntrophomonadaceae bacterium]MDD3023889.1 HD family phosphohydrolase [Syntrophomonadaceae bacterium]